MARPKLNRPISPAEAEIVLWMLRHASVKGSLVHLERKVAQLRVVGRCECGCPMVDFQTGVGCPEKNVIADATGVTADGVRAGVILWGTQDDILGLEVYACEEPVTGLPEIASLRHWGEPEAGPSSAPPL